jgi:capsule polysaccharide export protein KpsE/RkpR
MASDANVYKLLNALIRLEREEEDLLARIRITENALSNLLLRGEVTPEEQAETEAILASLQAELSSLRSTMDQIRSVL